MTSIDLARVIDDVRASRAVPDRIVAAGGEPLLRLNLEPAPRRRWSDIATRCWPSPGAESPPELS